MRSLLIIHQIHLEVDFVWSIESLVAVIKAETSAVVSLQTRVTLIWIYPMIVSNEQAGHDDLYLLFEEDLGPDERAVMIVVEYQGLEGERATLCAPRVPAIV